MRLCNKHGCRNLDKGNRLLRLNRYSERFYSGGKPGKRENMRKERHMVADGKRFESMFKELRNS